MPGPILWGPNNTSNNLQNQILEGNGELLQNNGAKNYISYNNFENGLTTGWSLGTVGTLTNGIPTGTPTFGSGASGNLTLSTSTVPTLADTRSLSLASSAATTQGDMLATQAYSVDYADRVKVLTFKFYYVPVFGNTNGNWSGTSSNSFGVAIWDVTNSVWLSSAGNFAMTQSSGGVGIATGTCQTNLTTASVRFVIYNANATAGSITMVYDRFYLGPQTAPIGAVVTDWQTYTSTNNWTNNTSTGQYKRVGDSAQIQTKISLTATPSGGSLSVALPPGLTIDTSKTPIDAQTAIGYYGLSGNSANYYGNVAVVDSTHVTAIQNTTDTGLNPQAIHGAAVGSGFGFVNGNVIDIFYQVPIVGWSSQVQMSSDTDTRVIAAQYNTNAGTSITAAVTDIPFTALTYDTSGSWNGSQFVTPVSGYYTIAGSWRSSTSISQNTNVYVNGVFGIRVNIDIANTQVHQLIPGQVKLNAGDLLSIRSDATVTLQASPDSHWIAISRISGPAVVASNAKVFAKYYLSANLSVTSNTAINFDTKVADSHNAVTVGSGTWRFTAPITGFYNFGGALASSETAMTFTYQLYKSGSLSEFLSSNLIQNGSHAYTGGIYLLAGQYMDIRPQSTAGMIIQGTPGTTINITMV